MAEHQRRSDHALVFDKRRERVLFVVFQRDFEALDDLLMFERGFRIGSPVDVKELPGTEFAENFGFRRGLFEGVRELGSRGG